MIDAIDISQHQGAVDFDAVAASDVRLVIVKATEGRDFVDPRFAENWSALIDRPDLARGAYHFARIDSDQDDPDDAEVEALDFVAAMKRAGGYLDGCTCPWLDVEWKGVTSDPDKNVAWVRRWVEVCEAELGRSPGIYTGHNVWRDRLGNSDAFVSLPLWQVDINRSSGNPHDMGPPWSWALHQYSHTGSVPGIVGNVDLDVVRDEATLEQLLTMRLVSDPHSLAVDPLIDLAGLDSGDVLDVVKVLQGGLLARGYGPDGLVDGNGLPDGRCGDGTRKRYSEFRADRGLSSSTVVDGGAWWLLRVVQM
jgi:GH25 family lysozyme M1 (1,4-beta-N-acetylmuramidase)